jgi:hypothetical protein
VRVATACGALSSSLSSVAPQICNLPAGQSAGVCRAAQDDPGAARERPDGAALAGSCRPAAIRAPRIVPVAGPGLLRRWRPDGHPRTKRDLPHRQEHLPPIDIDKKALRRAAEASASGPGRRERPGAPGAGIAARPGRRTTR